MTLLALEGALGGFSAAVVRDGIVLATRHVAGNVALEAGLGAVSAVLAEAAVAPNELDRLAVGIGPGGFTGLRITIAYAKSLAQAWELPLVPVSSFDALEYGHDLERAFTVVVGRPGIISARYRDGATIRRASGPIREVLAAVLPANGPEELAVVGAPEDVLAALAEGGSIVKPVAPLVMPPAAAVALAAGAARAAASAHAVSADYGEAPAAKLPSFAKTARPR
ncbi:MAG: tRNA (adenosine(37)-N6)-threonylcarbamoyltransferase complex dimerization subunit type 1 TsaB [bacterium]|nr:tRNA (adenosine(37)-N6)-threonylcarbamoyltransferase complex dimerization subunit type 1 TsaB [bacterium]